MSEEKDYNGYTNYETWCCALWLDNDQGTYEYWKEQAAEIAESAEDNKPEHLTAKEFVARELAERIKSEFEESMPKVEGFWADMLNSAMSEINWDEVAETRIEE
jgi:hypothetical protein